MIQIQDDNINPSAAASKPVFDPNQFQTSSYAPPSSSGSDDKSTSNSAEIDQLLADLDKLSKESSSKAAPSAPTPASESEASVASAEAAPELTRETENKSPASSSDFDFDAFLADLEEKIDQESEQRDKVTGGESARPVTQMTDFPDSRNPLPDDDFRKNRSTPSLDEDDSEQSAELDQAAEKESENVDLSDVTDMMEPKAETQAIKADALDTEELKAQNIFEMLGLANISDDEKNQFLDELEMMIWDDFVIHDLKLLLSSEEYDGARQIMEKSAAEEEKKEALIVYLEKLIPDLDEVLYEKALELKSEMIGERLDKMKKDADQATLDKIKEAEDLISQNRWKSAVSLLNQLS